MLKKTRVCGMCGEKLIEQTIDRVERYRKSAGVVVFEDVPVLQCVKCGEQWFTNEILEAMENI